jgi:hypothetical protein
VVAATQDAILQTLLIVYTQVSICKMRRPQELTSEFTVSIQLAARLRQESSTVFKHAGFAVRLCSAAAEAVGLGVAVKLADLAGEEIVEGTLAL